MSSEVPVLEDSDGPLTDRTRPEGNHLDSWSLGSLLDETSWDLIGLPVQISVDRFVLKASDLGGVHSIMRQLASRDPEEDRPVVHELVDEDREVGRAEVLEVPVLVEDTDSDVEAVPDLEVVAIEIQSELVALGSCVED